MSRRTANLGTIVFAGCLGIIRSSEAEPAGKQRTTKAAPEPRHRIVYHVSTNDPATMQRALGTADNVFKLYRTRGETARITVVANGGGVHMMRSDTTPVGPMLQHMRNTDPDLVLTACGATRTIMATNEARPVPLLDGVGVAPAGIVRVVELQQQGYAYVKP